MITPRKRATRSMCAHALSYSCTSSHTQIPCACISAQTRTQPRASTLPCNPPRPLRHSHLLPSSTLLNFPAPVRVSPFFYPPLSSLNVSSGTQESSVGQETRKNVRTTTADLHCCDQLINLKMTVLGSFLFAVWSRQLSNSFKMNFSQNFSPPLPVYTCYARLSLRITHGVKQGGASALQGSECSPPLRHAPCSFTKWIVPALMHTYAFKVLFKYSFGN